MKSDETTKRTEVIRVRVTEAERAFLEDLSKASDRSVSSLIRVAIHNYYVKPAQS
jgi:Ribbon-helix-helix protein, copG family